MEEAQQRCARARNGERHGERENPDRQRDGEHAAVAPAAGDARAHCACEGRCGRDVEVYSEDAELELEVGHANSSCSRASARCVLDLTAPRATPIATAVSSYE